MIILMEGMIKNNPFKSLYVCQQKIFSCCKFGRGAYELPNWFKRKQYISNADFEELPDLKLLIE